MPQFLPFRGLRYTAAAGALSDLLAPPYDVISPTQQAQLASRNARNAVHLELAEGGNERYAQVAALLEQWLLAGYLEREPADMFYVYEQEFSEDGRPFTRRALMAAVEAQPWEEGAVKPHEFTMSGPKDDRLKLLEATRTQFSPVFMIARDRAGQLRQFIDDTIASRGPDAEGATIDGEQHRLWVVEGGRYEMRRLAPLLAESFYIADGHHRYETAVTYRQRLSEREGELPRDHPARFAMTAIVAADDPGLVIRPIHRIVPRPAPAGWATMLADAFDVEPAGTLNHMRNNQAAIDALLAEGPGTIIALNAEPGQAHCLRLRRPGALAPRLPSGRSERWAAIAPNVLRYGVLEPLWGIGDAGLKAGAVEYTHDTADVFAAVTSGPGATAFLINHVGIGEVMALADQGERMPQKSTFFHPKLGTGLVFYPLYS